VTITGDSGTATLTLGSISPGKAGSSSTSNPNGFSVTVGNVYSVSISVTATGSSLTKALTTTCTGS
jgi:hypothetical protein